MNTRALLVSHTIFFVAGFAAGKLIDRDELEIYRSIHETGFTKFRRTAERVALGILALGTVIIAVRIGRK
jgi:Ni/Fe-hydrogenase subunit HybB-like protein